MQITLALTILALTVALALIRPTLGGRRLQPAYAALLTTRLLAAGASAVMNNHPVAGIMALAIGDMPLSGIDQRLTVYAALIGGDVKSTAALDAR